MATTQDFMDYLFDQIDDRWNKRYRKMFGEYLFYINERPLLLVCDNTVYVKELECLSSMVSDLDKGSPYKGAKEHYIVDAENKELLDAVISELVKVVQIPVKRKKRG
jgi:TfoX/Sxy family transcriptional regulator of competence genes